jgi:hypothetical protein
MQKRAAICANKMTQNWKTELEHFWRYLDLRVLSKVSDNQNSINKWAAGELLYNTMIQIIFSKCESVLQRSHSHLKIGFATDHFRGIASMQ